MIAIASTCDRCPANAAMSYLTTGGGSLLLCAHHARVHADALAGYPSILLIDADTMGAWLLSRPVEDCPTCHTAVSRYNGKHLITGKADCPEPENCSGCGQRRQWNVDGEIVHARTGTYGCPERWVVELRRPSFDPDGPGDADYTLDDLEHPMDRCLVSFCRGCGAMIACSSRDGIWYTCGSGEGSCPDPISADGFHDPASRDTRDEG